MSAKILVTALALCFAFETSALAQSNPPSRSVLTRVAFGSCANQELPQPIWSSIRAYRPEIFIFGGDNVYGNIRSGKRVEDDDKILDAIAWAYAEASKIQEFQRFRKEIPHLAVWDDNDFGKNDGGADFVHKGASQDLFLDFWDIPKADPRRARQGLFHAITVGPPGKRVQVILLDTRSFRSPLKPTDKQGSGRERYLPDFTPEKTMLGETQWTWLADRFREPADLRLVVSSIQVLAQGHGYERWGNLPLELKRLTDLIADTGAQRVVLLSGDRHFGAIYRSSDRVPYPLYEITSSGLTHSFLSADERDEARVGPLYGGLNFGTVDIDWWAESVTLSVRSLNGEPVRQQRIDLKEISRAP
jgi:alkaline phosphatase D